MIKQFTTILALLMFTILVAACGPATVTDTNIPDVVDTLESVTLSPSTTQSVDELIAMVNDYVASGEITDQGENGLLAKLETIREKLMNGQLNPASNEMGAFINEVQAQLGKKISEPAATALIAKAQAVAAELTAGVPVTGGEVTATAVTTDTIPQTTDTPVTAELSNPTPMGEQLEHQAQWDAIALQVAQAVGVNTFDYDLFQLPANTSWEDTLAYYGTEAAAAGWGDAPSQTNEMAFGHYALWSVVGADGKTNHFVVAQVDAPDGTYTLNLFGNE